MERILNQNISPSILCYSGRDLPPALSLCCGTGVSYCRCHCGLPERKRHRGVLTSPITVRSDTPHIIIKEWDGAHQWGRSGENEQDSPPAHKKGKLQMSQIMDFQSYKRLIFALRRAIFKNNILPGKYGILLFFFFSSFLSWPFLMTSLSVTDKLLCQSLHFCLFFFVFSPRILCDSQTTG